MSDKKLLIEVAEGIDQSLAEVADALRLGGICDVNIIPNTRIITGTADERQIELLHKCQHIVAVEEVRQVYSQDSR